MTDIEKLYELVIEEKELTTKLLKQEGFSQYEITKMVNENILVREKIGHYCFTDYNGIYSYGKSILSSDKQKARKCFHIGYNINPKDDNINIQGYSEEDEEIDADGVYTNYISLLNSLSEHDYDIFFDDLDIYLEAINHKELEHVIADIIKLNLQEQKEPLEAVSLLLTKTLMPNYEFSLDCFLNSYYANVYLGNTDIAEKYLEFIKKYQNLAGNTIHIENLEECLPKKDNKQVLFTVQPRVETRNDLDESAAEVKFAKEKEQKELVECFEKKVSLLSERNPIEILKPMNKENVTTFFSKVENYNDIISKFVLVDGKKRILLKKQYTEEERKLIDIYHISNLANEMYKEDKYDRAMALYKKCICYSHNPNPFLYSRVGFIYLLRKGKEKKKAIPYFEAAISAAIEKNHKNLGYYLGLENVISNLKYDIPEEEIKNTANINMEEYEFYDDMNDHYGIDVYDDIVTLVGEGHMNIEDACLEFDLDDEDINIMKLIYVRNYYSERFFDKGDELYKEVERSTNKTPFIYSLMNEIKTNKKLYQYRSSVKMKTKK